MLPSGHREVQRSAWCVRGDVRDRYADHARGSRLKKGTRDPRQDSAMEPARAVDCRAPTPCGYRTRSASGKIGAMSDSKPEDRALGLEDVTIRHHVSVSPRG